MRLESRRSIARLCPCLELYIATLWSQDWIFRGPRRSTSGESLQGIKLGPSSMPAQDIHTELGEPHGSSMIYMLHFEEHTKFPLSSNTFLWTYLKTQHFHHWYYSCGFRHGVLKAYITLQIFYLVKAMCSDVVCHENLKDNCHYHKPTRSHSGMHLKTSGATRRY